MTNIDIETQETYPNAKHREPFELVERIGAVEIHPLTKQEISISDLGAGALIKNMRSGIGRWEGKEWRFSASFDGGKTWGEYKTYTRPVVVMV